MNKEFLVIRETNNDPLRSKLLCRSNEREQLALCTSYDTRSLPNGSFMYSTYHKLIHNVQQLIIKLRTSYYIKLDIAPL